MTEYPKPPFAKQSQPMPGRTVAMDPLPDHGEKSYRGSGKLAGIARHIVTTMKADFDPAAMNDREREAVIGLLKDKRKVLPELSTKGKAAKPSATNIINLMDALKKSLSNKLEGTRPHSPGQTTKGVRARRPMTARRKDPGPKTSLRAKLADVVGAVRAAHPGFIEPALATLRAHAMSGSQYIHEIKFDGYRLQAHMRNGLVSLWTRGGLDWTRKFSSVATGAGRIAARNFVIDGEVISADKTGAANFSDLQADIAKGRLDRMVYYAFDLLYLDGYDLRAARLIERKRILAQLLKADPADITPVLLSDHFEDDGPLMFTKSCEMGLEGIISKLRDAPYRSGRSEDWLKAKCIQTGRYEVIGYKSGVTSLYLGRREGNEFLYAGKAGTGYTNTMIFELAKLVRPITVKRSPLTKKAGHKIDCWVEPKYWAEVEYRDITSHGHLRHVTFRGLYDSRTAKKPLVAKFKDPS